MRYREGESAMRVYLDLFFFVNIGMNLVVLMLECFFQNRMVRLRRLLAAAVVGAVLALLFLLSGIHRFIWLLIPLYAVGSGIIVWMAFGRTTAGAFVRNLIFFYAAAFLLGGILTQVQGLTGVRGSAVLLLAVSGAVLWTVYRLTSFIGRERERRKQYYPVSLTYGGRTVTGVGFYDTGNRLTEPFSRLPVAIGEKKFVSPLFSGEDEPVLRYIPFHSIGRDSGTIPVFRAEYLRVRESDGSWRCREKPWIAIYDSYVSADGEYELILNPDMMLDL